MPAKNKFNNDEWKNFTCNIKYENKPSSERASKQIKEEKEDKGWREDLHRDGMAPEGVEDVGGAGEVQHHLLWP